MSLIDLMKARYSVRQYQSTPVEEEKLMAVLEAGRVAPTAANRQPQRIYVVRTPEALGKLAKAANIHNPPLALIVCADKSEAWVRPIDQKDSCDIDASIVTDHMMLRATELGLGSCFLMGPMIAFADPALRGRLGLPEGYEPLIGVALGYAAGERPAPPDRKSDNITWCE